MASVQLRSLREKAKLLMWNTISELASFFEVSVPEFARFWDTLTNEEKTYFRYAPLH